jgi:hypothetical protein
MCQGPVFDAFDRPKRLGQLLDFLGPSLHGDDLQAMIVVEMDVLGREHEMLIIMLKVGQTAEKILAMMVVNQGHRAGDLVPLGPFQFDQLASDQIAESVGPAGPVVFTDIGVELGQQAFLQRDPESDQIAHRLPMLLSKGIVTPEKGGVKF